MAADLADLIARCEQAEGPDRALDAEIAGLCDPTDDPRLAAFESGDDYPRRYTESLDAALALVPEGWAWKLLYEPANRLYRVVIRHAPKLEIVALAYVVTAQTPALALVIASLRARAQGA